MSRGRTIAAVAAILLAAGASSGCASKANSDSDTTVPQSIAAAGVVGDTTTPVSVVEDTTIPISTASTAPATSATTADSPTTSSLAGRLATARDALQAGNFGLMLQALDLSGLGSTVEANKMTILAPTDAAFGNLTGSDAADLLTNVSKIDDVLKRHMLDGLYTYDQISKLTSVRTVGGDTLPVTFQAGVLKVDGATVTRPSDMPAATQGQDVVVLGIDRVLLAGS